jgi:LysR family transcriptional regulator for bpeEF and oprC
MDRLHAMNVFAKVVEMNSFWRAADSLNIPHGSATTVVKNLESHLNVRLLQRTTRRLNLTPEGAEYYQRCAVILAEIEEAEASLTQTGKGPKGKLRVDMTASIGRLIVMPRLSEFQEEYPDIELMIGMSDRFVDLVQDGVDCALRVGSLEDSSLVARRLLDLQTMTVASPRYLALHGVPTNIDDLRSHRAVHYFSSRTGRVADMNFTVENEAHEMKLRGSLTINDADAYVMAAVTGAGLAQAPRFMLLPYLRSGELIEVLPRCTPRPMPIAAVYPHNRHLSPKVRVFVDWIAKLFNNHPLMSTIADEPISRDHRRLIMPSTISLGDTEMAKF